MTKIIAVLGLLCVSVAVFADKDKGVYFGGGINLVTVGAEDRFRNDVNFKAGEVILGYKHNNYLGLEVRGGASLDDEVIAIRDTALGLDEAADSNIEEYFSVYYRAELANEIAKLYLLVGQSAIKTRTEFGDDSFVQSSDTGFSYGIGFGLWLDERMNLNFEFKNLVDTQNDSFVAGGINADYRF